MNCFDFSSWTYPTRVAYRRNRLSSKLALLYGTDVSLRIHAIQIIICQSKQQSEFVLLLY